MTIRSKYFSKRQEKSILLIKLMESQGSLKITGKTHFHVKKKLSRLILIRIKRSNEKVENEEEII